MESKALDLKQSVYTLCTQYPELVDILKKIGFADITKPGMLATAGRFMTIPKGAALKRIDLAVVKSMLAEHGFQVSE